MPENVQEQLDKYLTDVHSISRLKDIVGRATGIPFVLFAKSQPDTTGKLVAHAYSYEHLELARPCAEHLEETRRQQGVVEDRLDAHGSGPSRLKDAVMRLGALNWGGFFAAQPDTPGKLAGFAFAFEHLEIGACEQLGRVARRAGDADTEQAAARIVAEERAFAKGLESHFDRAIDASLRVQGVLA